MRIGWSIIASLALVVAVLGAVGCVAETTGESNFNLIFRYGVGAKNELNTFEGTYTKDMISAPPITVDLSLSEEEVDRIYQKMVEVDFFNYSEIFSVSVPPGESMGVVTPYYSYYFKVEDDSRTKELWWEDEIVEIGYQDEKASGLRRLIRLITGIIESSEEYQKLPEPSSGYM